MPDIQKRDAQKPRASTKSTDVPGNAPGKMLRHPLITVLIRTLFIALTAAFVLTQVIALHRMTGNSMFASVKDGDLLVFSRLGEPTIGDVILYETDGTVHVGRIVAYGGQEVGFPEEGGYEINGYQPAEEIPYPTYQAKKTDQEYPLIVPDGSFFVLNDYRADTSDSRTSGIISGERVRGKLCFLFRRRGF